MSRTPFKACKISPHMVAGGATNSRNVSVGVFSCPGIKRSEFLAWPTWLLETSFSIRPIVSNIFPVFKNTASVNNIAAMQCADIVLGLCWVPDKPENWT